MGSVLAFSVAAAVVVALLFGLSVFVWSAKRDTLGRIQARVVGVKRWGGFVLLGVGAWLIATAVFARQLTSIFRV